MKLVNQQFNNLLAYIQEINMPHWNKELALGVYLSRLRHGYTFDELAIHFNITRKTASEYANSCRQACLTLCVKYLTFSMSRDTMIQYNNEIALRIHAATANKIILVLDGTYLFIQKSDNFDFQRNTYSRHKHRNLIKPMKAVFTNGYIAYVWGLYKGAENDPSIMNNLLDKDLWSAFEDGDVFIVNRGFRDSIDKIRNRDFIQKMPAFSEGPNELLTTKQANKSRLITKSRYIVEVRNGRIKQQFQYFNKTIQNTIVLSLFNDFKVACALYNFTFTPVLPKYHDLIIERMLYYSVKDNLSKLMKEKNLNMKSSIYFIVLKNISWTYFQDSK